MPQWKKQENVQRSTQVQFWREGKKRDKSQLKDMPQWKK